MGSIHEGRTSREYAQGWIDVFYGLRLISKAERDEAIDLMSKAYGKYKRDQGQKKKDDFE